MAMHYQKERFVVGVSIEGRSVNAVQMRWKPGESEIISMKSLLLPDGDEAPKQKGDYGNLDISNLNEVVESNAIETINDDNFDPDTDVLREIIAMTEGGRHPIALAVGEPQVYYNIFEKSWGLSGKKLIKKLIAESGINRSSANIETESVRLLPMKNGRIVAISHEKNLPVYYRLESVARQMGVKPPKILLVDGVELAIINLIHEYQCPLDGSATIIVHVSGQTSRFIFMQGKEIHQISHLICEGSDKTDIAVKLYNKLQFELDNSNIKRLDSIILTGSIANTGLQDLFERYFGTKIVKVLKLHSINTFMLDYSERENLPAFAPAIGAACRLIDDRMKCIYEIDLTPTRIKDMQNRLSLSAAGWALLILIPVLIIGILLQIKDRSWDLRQYQAALVPKKVQMTASVELENKIADVGQRLNMFEKTGVILDSIKAGSHSYGEFLGRMMEVSEAHKGTWITEVASGGEAGMQMVGYALDRNVIPAFAREIAADIKMVDAQEIREHPVYRFEMSIDQHVAQ